MGCASLSVWVVIGPIPGAVYGPRDIPVFRGMYLGGWCYRLGHRDMHRLGIRALQPIATLCALAGPVYMDRSYIYG